MRCHWCGEELRWDAGRGLWVHEGGGTYVQYCTDCGWKGAPHPSVAVCPRCGGRNVRDHHAALPAWVMEALKGGRA